MTRPTTILDDEFGEAVLSEHWKLFKEVVNPTEDANVQQLWTVYLHGVNCEVERG